MSTDWRFQPPSRLASQLGLLLAVLTVIALASCVTAAEPQLTVPCKIVEVYDGDTVTVEVTMRVRVRLLDCWCPEIRTRDDAEKQRGLKARDHLRAMAEGKDALLTVPLTNVDRLDDVLTLGRLLGRLSVSGVDVSEAMVAAGLATREGGGGSTSKE